VLGGRDACSIGPRIDHASHPQSDTDRGLISLKWRPRSDTTAEQRACPDHVHEDIEIVDLSEEALHPPKTVSQAAARAGRRLSTL
jgi:hypothetical protein